MNENKNLWPELKFDSVITPKAILTEQAYSLSRLTKNVLKGSVHAGGNKENLIFNLGIIAPALNNYTLDICTIQHKLVKWYPLTVTTRPQNKSYSCKDEEEFIGLLKNILRNNDLLMGIKSLYAQSVGK